MIKYESECQTVTRNECRTVYDTEYEQVDTDSLESALETKSEECQYEKQELVSLFVPTQECTTVYDEVCDSAIPSYGLDNSLSSASAVDSYGSSAAAPCRSVPRSECSTVPRQVERQECGDVPSQECSQVPRRVQEEV